MKGWLDNYNDSKISVPEGFEGEGYSTKGRDYSPAWGGQFQMGGQAPKRRGVRYNEDGSVSTHLMRTETDGKGNWFSFPTLFQNSIPYADDSENWVDMSDRPWEEAYEEAKKRGEVINFGSDKDAAIKFGQGSWKEKMQMGGNVSDEEYNMKRALELGYTADESGHWPSVDDETGEWLKSKKHHTRGMELMAYELNPELRNKYNLIENEKGKLQYVPKLQKIEEYQMGGNVYPVNYVSEAQDGKKTPKLDTTKLDFSIPKSTGYAWADEKLKKQKKALDEFKKVKTKVDTEVKKIQKKHDIPESTAREVYKRQQGLSVPTVEEVREYTPQSTLSKTWDVITNPMTAAGYVARNEDLPDYFTRGERNNLDMATDVVNPAAWVNYAGHGIKDISSVPGKLIEGDFKGAGTSTLTGAINLLGAVPIAQELKPFVPSAVKPLTGLNVRRGLNNFANELVAHARSLGPNRQVVTNSFGNEQLGNLVQRLRSNQPLGEMQIGSLGQAYNSGSLSRADSELFTRYLINRNRNAITPDPPGGLFGMTAEEIAEEIAERYARMQENPWGWGTERWNPNQLPPPPSEIRFNIDGSTESIYSARPQYRSHVPGPGNIDLRRPINGHAPGTPEWERLNNKIWEAQNMIKPTVRNKSGYTKEDLLNQASSKDKDIISKMTEKEFQETVFTPKGEVLTYKPSVEIDQMAPNPVTGGSVLKDQIPLSNEEYVKIFNENIDILNDIISKNNKSGVNYSVLELTPSGQLIFNTPAQKVAANRSFLDILRTPVNKFKNVVRNEMDLAGGQSSWAVNIKPGQWRGEVENIANPEYYKSIPGLDMSNTSRSVFADNIPRRGTGTYESINEYLKRLDLGRVKPGFNSQTQFSRGLWENAIKKDKAFGFYGNPGTVYGSMKSIAPYLGIGGVGAAAASQTEEEVPQQKQGGVIKDDRGQWAHPGEITKIGSNQITMKGVPYPVLGISNTGDMQMMYPDGEYEYDGESVTEFPMAKNGLRQEQKGLVNLDNLTNFTNYNTKQPGGWLDKY